MVEKALVSMKDIIEKIKRVESVVDLVRNFLESDLHVGVL
jgi:hypothetical protein